MCFAHTINLATQAGLGVPRVARLLGRFNGYRVVNFQAETATIAITQVNHGRYDAVEQHVGYAGSLPRAASCHNSSSHQPRVKTKRSIDTLDSCDVRDAEDLVKLLCPLKTATTVLREEKSPTVSLIVPLKSMIEQSMTPNDGDSTTTAILTNIANRYSGDAFNYLLECTVLDPRFRTLPQLDHDQCEAVFLRVQNKAEQLLQKQTTAEEREGGAAGGAHCPTHGREEAVRDDEPKLTEPAPKKTALEDLLGNSFSTEPEESNSSKQAEREVENYRKEASIPLSGRPLKWWQEHCSQYPLLSHLAKACLSVPATSVPITCPESASAALSCPLCFPQPIAVSQCRGQEDVAFGPQPKQGSPDFPLPSHFVQLFPGDPEAFPGQPRDIVSPACPGSSPGSPTSGTCPEHLTREASGRHHNQMPEPPHLASLNAEE
ncbi:Zinc finger BED domain-containing protein 1 [Merluccius polli]|uniref:Zinc finger BED domain-containing protein 1 n=1 Tax=Merluccius polli TaxID=89951 RepID=A0AA47MZ64_MERPO|nr:Zinc finger BED domain-containing protein 1 [Merluccius polli]